MLDSHPKFERACQRTDRIDCDFLFGNVRHPCSCPGSSPSPRLGITQVRGGPVLIHTNYSIAYLVFETTPGSLSECYVTLTPGRWWSENSLIVRDAVE